MSRELKAEVEIHHARMSELGEMINQHEYLTAEGLTKWTGLLLSQLALVFRRSA
jgi:hypothetical protein